MATIGLVTAGVVGYYMMSKETKIKADKFLNSVMDDVTHKANKINNNVNK